MNQQNQIKIGNIVPVRILTATQVGYPDSEEHLTEILSTFNRKDILITLARINLLLQLSDDPLESEEILRQNFCADILLNEIDWRNLTEYMIFNRESTLFLLSKSVQVADPDPTRDPDSTEDAKNELARCYLIANEFISQKNPDVGTDSTEKRRKELPVKLIPSLEYALTPSMALSLKNKIVRSKEFLTRFQKLALTFDVNETFQMTGLTPQEYQYLILGIVAPYLRVPPEKIGNTEVWVNTKPSPSLTPLYEKLLPHTAIPIDELAEETLSSLDNEFLLWRKYPLVKISEDLILCIDIGFLLDKVETGVFWIIHEQLKEKDKGKKIIDLRGEVFEDYAASIIERGINVQTPSSMEKCIISPTYIEKEKKQCTDIAVCSSKTLILLECKASLLSAQTKFSGDTRKFYQTLKDRIIEPSGIEQLWNAIHALGHTDEKERREVKGIDICRVKKIYPVLVLSDRIFSLLLLNRFLNSEFQRFVQPNDLEDYLEIMPLTVLTIEDLELLEPYLRDTPFHAHLDKWITQFFNRNDFFPFSQYLRSLMEGEVRQNTYMDREFKKFSDDMKEYFSLRGIN